MEGGMCSSGSKTVCPMNGHEAGLHSSSLQTLPACSLDLASAVSGAREEPWRWLLPCWVDMGTEACAVLIPVAQAPAAPRSSLFQMPGQGDNQS